MKTIGSLTILIVITVFCMSQCSSREANTEWKVFRAKSKTLTVSAGSLSPIQVKVEEPGPDSTITLIGWEKVGPPVATSKELGKIVRNSLHRKLGDGDGQGPLLSGTLDFIIQDPNNNEVYLVMREIKLNRIVLIPLTEMGQMFLEKRSGILIVGDTELRAISENWIKSLK